jgi:hypothetical protein
MNDHRRLKMDRTGCESYDHLIFRLITAERRLGTPSTSYPSTPLAGTLWLGPFDPEWYHSSSALLSTWVPLRMAWLPVEGRPTRNPSKMCSALGGALHTEYAIVLCCTLVLR